MQAIISILSAANLRYIIDLDEDTLQRARKEQALRAYNYLAHNMPGFHADSTTIADMVMWLKDRWTQAYMRKLLYDLRPYITDTISDAKRFRSLCDDLLSL